MNNKAKSYQIQKREDFLRNQEIEEIEKRIKKEEAILLIIWFSLPIIFFLISLI